MAAFLAFAAPTPAQTCQPVAVECLQPQGVIEDDGARFAWGSTSGNDAWVARFDGGSKDPTWRAELGGSGDDSIAALARSADGAELFAAGSTTSAALDGFTGRSSGGRDGFVARLDAVTGRVLSGAFVGGSGDEELSGVITDGAGNVLVAGIGSVTAFGAKPASLTVIEADSAGPGSPAFVATLDGRLRREQARYDLGTIRVSRPRVWTDCQGNPVVGVVTRTTGPCNGNWPELVYEQDQINQDYSIDHVAGPYLGNPPGGWVYHGLRWKKYHANVNFLDWWYNANYYFIPVPKHEPPSCSTAATMNQLEPAVFSQNGLNSFDPAGGWLCGNHADKAQLALYAAHFFRKWGTPVYITARKYDDLAPSGHEWKEYTAGLERVVFKPYCDLSHPNGYHGEKLENLCDLMVNSPHDLKCKTNSLIPGVVGPTYYLQLDRFEGRAWSFPWGGNIIWFNPWTLLGDVWGNDDWHKPGDYVIDPPDGSETELAVLQEAARQTADQIVRQGRVQVTWQVRGVPTCTETVEAVIPASE